MDRIMKKQKTFKNISVKTGCIFLFSAVLLSSVGCGKKTESYDGYYVYCMDTNETKVEGEEYTPKAEETNELIKEFLKKMDQEPENISLKKAIPENVKIDDYTISSAGDLCLYWPAGYGNYTGISEILRRSAIVKTLCQIPGVNTVEFYVAGQPLTDSNMNAVGFMTADTFIDNTGAEAYTKNTTLAMYFSNKSGTKLKEVSVEITYDATIPLEQLAVEQLINGPASIKGISDAELIKTIPDGTKLNKVSVKENTCYLDFSDDFMEKRPDISDNVAIYSVVNTLTELPDINKVQFSIDGERKMLYDEYMGFGEAFESNLDIVE